MKLAAVVLAAGGSTRMGRPKALVPWRGRTFVEHCILLAGEAGADPVVVVQGATELGEVVMGPAILATNEGWERGPLSSLQTGLRLLDEAFAVLVLTVDRPHVEGSTIRALAGAHEGDEAAVWQPRLGGQRGHPIVYPADLVREILALDPQDTPRTLLHRDDVAARRRVIDVDDVAVLDNIDCPPDLARLPA